MINKLYVTNYGSLVNFSNEDNQFNSQNAVVHGLNGSGKSQICLALRQISKIRKSKIESAINRTEIERQIKKFLASRLSKEALTPSIKITIDNYSLSLNTETLVLAEDGNPPDIYVFNENYIDENVGDLINLPDQEIKIGQKNVIRDDFIKEKNEKEKALKNVIDEIEKALADHRSITGYGGQVRTEKIISKENYLKEENTGESYANAKDQIERLANPPEQIISHLRFTFPELTIKDSTWENIENILISPLFEPKLTNEIHNTYISIKKGFFEDGIEIFSKEKTACPFCLTPKNSDDPVISELISYLGSNYNNNLKVLSGFIKTLELKKQSIDTFLENWNAQLQYINEKADLMSLDDKLIDIVYDTTLYNEISNIIRDKIENMSLIFKTEEINFKDRYFEMSKNIEDSYSKHIANIQSMNKNIEQISSLKRSLGEKIIKNQMHVFWHNKSLRERYLEINSDIEELKKKIDESSVHSSNDSIPDFFNQIIRILGINKYELNRESSLILKLDNNYDISKEGYRISSGERKFIALSYFLAEVLASAGSNEELTQKTVVIDDPVDSSDYEKFYSFISVIENFEKILKNIYNNPDIHFGQIIIFTHNALLYERFINSQKLSHYTLTLENSNTIILKPKKKISLSTFSSYIKKITGYIKRMNEANTKDIGNYIRRVLEIICSVENIDTNEITNLSGSSKLNALANHLSHESIERMLDPLPYSYEYIEACIELIEEVQNRMPYLYKSIVEKYLDNNGIEYYRKEYIRKYL